MKKKCILISLIITLIMNSIITIPISSIAAIEDGDFIKEELEYDIVFKEISMGENHTLAIDKDGNLWAWGYNYDGQLGDGSTNSTTCPKLIKKGTKFKKISAGYNYSMAIDENGKLWSWGNNLFKKLGRTTSITPSYLPEKSSYVPEQTLADKKFVQVSAGRVHTLAIDEEGYLWEWGHDGGYSAGSLASDEPKKISSKKFTEISTKYNHSMAIDEEGYLWTWGNNDYGQLGNSSTERTTKLENIKSDTKFIQISAGYYHSIAIDENGNLWTWGNNEGGQLGNETEINSMIPIKIMRGKKFTQVSAGRNHSLAIDQEENLWVWGYNGYGQLGNETRTLSNVPIQIKNNTKFNQIFTGSSNSMAIDKGEILWAWGNNEYGQLGNGEKSKFTEKFVNINEEMQFEQVVAAREHTLAIDSEGNLWAWGNNEYGQLGNGTTIKSRKPIHIKEGTMFRKISSVSDYSLAIDSEGNLWAWGYNESGQLGDGSTENKNSPVQIKNGTKFTQISATYFFSLAIDSEGNLWAWGRNKDGELGDGSTENKNSPVQIKSGTKFTQISAGYSHSLAIDENGNVWAWGNNAYGQLGVENRGTSYNRSTPVQIESNTKFSQVAAGDRYSLAIDIKGNLWAWGSHNFETSTQSSTPTVVVYDTKFAQISVTPDSLYADNTHNSGIDINGNLWTWGNNKYGQLGNRTTVDSSTPSKVKNNCKMVANSNDVTYVIDNGGKLFVCGENKYGLFDSSYYTTPLQITGGIEYTVTFKDRTERTDTQIVKSGESAIAPNWTKPGYTLSWSTEFDNVTSDLIVNAIWTASTNTPYTVEHHLQNLNNTEYTKDNTATETKTGTTGEQTNAQAKTYTGFTAQPFEQKAIRGEGDTVVIIYYNRDKYTITLDPGEGTLPAGNEEIEYTYGEEKELPEPTRPGYDFDGWYDEEENKIDKITPTDKGDKELEAKWTARTDTAYKVVHHFRNIDLEVEGYDEEEEQKIGTTDTTVTAEYKEKEGFTKNEADARTVKQGTVAGNGSLVLHLYYTRNTYDITYVLNGGTESTTLTNKYTYGKEMILQTRVTKQGHTFAGWYDNEGLTGEPVISIPATATGNKTYYAKWTQNEFTVIFKNGETVEKTQKVLVGNDATAPSLSRQGYTLSWSTDFTNVNRDLTVEAVWTARNDTSYKVIHHFRNLDTEVEGYIDEEEQKAGTTDTTVTAEYKEREGFTKNEADARTVKEGTVAGNGSLVLHLYYTRNTYDITYVLNEGTANSSLTNKYVYGKEMILQTRAVTKEGYTFAGWYDNEELTGSPVTMIAATATGNKTFYAKWVEAEQEYYILSESYNIDLDEKVITKVSPKTSVADFLPKIETNGTCKVLNLKGEEVSGTLLVGTGYKLQVTFKDQIYIYEIAVRGDLDGNGKVTTTDLSIINQHILNKITLTGIKAKAADTDYNGRLTTTDLSMINQTILNKITL